MAAAFGLAACASATSPDAAPVSGRLTAAVTQPATPDGPGVHTFRAGASATLYIPASVKPGAPAPFILLLHGGGQRGGDMIRRFKDEADRRGIVLLAPDSARGTWDAVTEVARGHEPAFGEDVARIDAVLKEAFAHVAVDPKRMAIAGISDGAGYALSLGTRNSALFPMTMAFSAGMIVTGDTGPSSRIFVSHGDMDRVLPIALSRDGIVPALRQAGFKVEFMQFHGGHELPNDVLDRALDSWLGPN
jgi:phospholipase/carboxylesterase